MKRIGKFPIRVIGIIDRRLFDVKQKKNMEYNFFVFFFSKKLLKFIEYIKYLTIREEEFKLKILFCIFFFTYSRIGKETFYQ